MKAIKWIIVIALITVTPVLISNLEALNPTMQTSDKGFYPFLKFVHDWRIVSLPIFALLAIAVPTLKMAWTESRVKKAVRKKLLDTLLTDVFKADAQLIRITIFRDTNWFKVFWIWLTDSFWHPIKLAKRKGIHPFPRYWSYVIATERAGSENPHPNTYFRFVAKTAKQCEGIAAYTKQLDSDRERKFENLPDINGIEIDNWEALTDEQRTNVETYVEATYLQDKRVLKRLHLKARHFYTMVLRDHMLESRAILVVDSITNESPFSDSTDKEIVGYIKIFSTTF